MYGSWSVSGRGSSALNFFLDPTAGIWVEKEIFNADEEG
jgi:hypothetical protein